MLNSTCTLPQPFILDITAHLVFIISIPTYGIGLWVLGSKCPAHFRKYRNLLVAHVTTCLLMEIHMSVFWKMVGAVPWAAICAQGLFAEYAVQCFQFFVILLIFIGASVLNLFKLRMKAVCYGVMEKMQKVELAVEGICYVMGTVLIVVTVLAYGDLKWQNDYKKKVEQKFANVVPEYIWCDNCFFIRFDAPIVILFFILATIAITLILSQCSIATYISFKSLKSMKCRLSSKTISMQRNFLNSLFVMMSVHAIFMITPVILFLTAHIIPFPNELMPLSYSMVLFMQEHGTASTIAMLLTNKLLLENARKKFKCIGPRKISRIDTVVETST